MSQATGSIVSSSRCILGEIVDRLRAERLAGASVSQLVTDLRRRGVELPDVAQYFREAFLLSAQSNIAMIPRVDSGEPDPEILDDYIAGCIDAARQHWEHSPPFPDLRRRRDRIAFEQVARRHGVVLIVCAPDRGNPASRDGYRLHGVYSAETGANAWTVPQGEKLRAELNRRMGAELVQAGPLDIWADRLALEEGDPRRGPQPPVLFFLPDGNVEVRTSARAMELYYRFLGIDWDALYCSALTDGEDTE